MDLPKVVSAEEWEAANKRILAKEKEMTRQSDALAAERRRQPIMRVEKKYEFEGPNGKATLLDLFERRRQLFVYNFMFGPNQEVGCDGCSMVVDQLTHLAHLHARNTNFALASRALIEKLERYRKRMGWDVPWYSWGRGNYGVDLGLSPAEPKPGRVPGRRDVRTERLLPRRRRHLPNLLHELARARGDRAGVELSRSVPSRPPRDLGGLSRGLAADGALQVVAASRRVQAGVMRRDASFSGAAMVQVPSS
jgi:predicted dithiol-disulfide oxidoreductase (DUF899 family)